MAEPNPSHAFLEHTEEIFLKFVQYSPAAAFLKDADGRLTWANLAYLRIYGAADLDTVRGRTTHELDAVDVADAIAADELRVRTHGPRTVDIHAAGPQGTHFLFGYKFPHLMADGSTGVGGVVVDVTSQRDSEARCAALRARHEAVFTRGPMPMYVIAPPGEVLDANPAFLRMMGVSISAIRGRSADRLVHGPPSESEMVLNTTMRGGHQSRRVYTRGDSVTIPATVTYLRLDEPDEPIRVLAIVHHDPPIEFARQQITSREARLIELRAAGATNAEIARRLGLTSRGLDYNIRRLTRKMTCRTNPSALVARAYHLGLLDTGTWPPTVPAHMIEPERPCSSEVVRS